jgi:hypothetical protein
MESRATLQLFAVGMLAVGILGVTAFLAPGASGGLFPWRGVQALLVGVGVFAIGVVMLVDLRRRDRPGSGAPGDAEGDRPVEHGRARRP